MYYYFIPNHSKFYDVFVDKGILVEIFSSGVLIQVDEKIKGQSHYLVEDPLVYTNPSYFKDYWHLREALPFDVRVAIETAELTDPAVKAIIGDMKSAPILDRNDLAFIQGVAVLQNKGLLTQEQATSLLTYSVIV